MIELFFVAFTTVTTYQIGPGTETYYGGLRDEIKYHSTAQKACSSYHVLKLKGVGVWRIQVSLDMGDIVASKPVEIICQKF